MIINTELERKGNQFPNQVVDLQKDVDTLYFKTENEIILQLTVLRDSVDFDLPQVVSSSLIFPMRSMMMLFVGTII